MDNPIFISFVTAVVVALVTTLIPRLFSKRRDDTDIMVQLQKIAADAVNDKAEMKKEITRLEKKLDERQRNILLTVELKQTPLEVASAHAAYSDRRV